MTAGARWLVRLAVLAALAAGTWYCLRERPAAPAPGPVVQDTVPSLVILYDGEFYTVTDIQLAPDGKTFLAQFRTVKKVKTRRAK